MAKELNEREKQIQGFQKQLDKSSRLESLQSNDAWSVIDDVLNDLTIQFSGLILNGDPADHDTYLVNRAKLDGIRAVRDRFNRILNEGKQASNAIDTLTS
jgi:hypothetical protein